MFLSIPTASTLLVTEKLYAIASRDVMVFQILKSFILVLFIVKAYASTRPQLRNKPCLNFELELVFVVFLWIERNVSDFVRLAKFTPLFNPDGIVRDGAACFSGRNETIFAAQFATGIIIAVLGLRPSQSL